MKINKKSLYILGSFIFDGNGHLALIADDYVPFAKDKGKCPSLISLREMGMRAEKPKPDRHGRLRIPMLVPWPWFENAGQRPSGLFCFTDALMKKYLKKKH